MIYEGTIYRPPTEANTFLLQVTYGCTHNSCRFCAMFRDKKFRLIDVDVIDANLKEAKEFFDAHNYPLKRLFLTDGDVFSLSIEKLEHIINKVRSYFPECETFTMYAAVARIKEKTDEELIKLKELGVNDLYIGHESGDKEALIYMNKGHVPSDSVEQMARLNNIGIRHHALMVIGLSGAGTYEKAGKLSAELINQIHPGLAMFFTLALRDGSDLVNDVKEGRFTPPSNKEMLMEQIITLENITDPNVYFWASHMFNPYPVQGLIGEEKENMLRILKDCVKN